MNIEQLLYTDGSLTQALSNSLGQRVQVRILRELNRPANADEATRLNDSTIWQRDVILYAPHPVIFATTRVGSQALQKPLKPLLDLHERPLGEWMFQQPGLSKTYFNVNETLKMRDNIYEVDGHPIWIQEFFI